jgi:hypothetical protein
MVKKVLILADTNERAAVACLRGLKNYNVEFYIGLSQNKIRLKLPYLLFKGVTFDYFLSSNIDEFIHSIFKICKERNISIIIPTGELYLRWISINKETFCNHGIEVSILDYDNYIKISDKFAFINTCLEYDIITPKLIKVDKLEMLEPPYVLKPKELSKGVTTLKFPFLVQTPKDKNDILSMKLDLNNHFIQELVDGDSFYYSAFYENGIRKLYFNQKNIFQQQNGKSIAKAIPYDIPSYITDKVDYIFNDFKYTGVMMLEFIRSDVDGNFYAIECNPRFWGPLQLAVDNGYNFPALLCGFDSLNIFENKFGYLWFSGILSSYIKKWIYKSKPSINNSQNNVYFKDVWFRRDTIIYFFIDLIINFRNSLRK